MNNSEEQQIIDAVMHFFSHLRKSGPEIVANYLQTIPDPYLSGLALQKLRTYARTQPNSAPLSTQGRAKLSAQICQQVFNELMEKVRKRHTASDANLDGAELFYRRAVNQISRERPEDAERLLKRCVEIEPRFVDGWKLLSDVLEQNGKAEAAERARQKLSELRRD